MSPKPLLRIAAMVGVTLCAGGVLADHHIHGGAFMAGMGAEPGPGMMFPMILRGLGLSADQQTKVRDIMDKHRARFQDLFSQLRTAHEAMMAKLLAPGPVTADDLKAPTQKVAALRDQLTQEGIAVALEVRAVLTADQLAKAADVRQRLEVLREETRQLLGGSPLMSPADEP